jgi:hypothetical protein
MTDKYMKKKSNFSKFLLHLGFFICATTVFFGTIAGAWAYVRPANPIMDYVPQNIGIYDTYYENFHESDCRACHGSSTAERHHVTSYALQGDCAFCHLDGVQPERDCKICHIDGGPIGDLGSPHHRTDFAGIGQCNQCHTNVIETNSVDPPGFTPTSITPTPFSCENCHWPSGSVPHEAATYDGNTLEFLADWQSWTGYPVLTTWPDGLAHPQPIEANGPVLSGTSGMKPFPPSEGTHHNLGAKVYNRCYYCHASAPGTSPNWDPNNPYLIRFCENCHDVNSLHSIQAHVTDDNIYRVSGIGNQGVTANMKCVACHNNSYILDVPPLPVDIPVIDHIEPNFGPPGITINILPASGICFNEDPVNGLCSFGLKSNGDSVKMGQKDMFGNWYWVDTPIESWSEHRIQIKVPEQTLDMGKTFLKVYKEQVGTSATKVFVVLYNPVINYLKPSYAHWGQDVLIDGDRLTVEKEKIYHNGAGYGHSSYIELTSSGNKYRVTNYLWQEPWYPGKIFIRLADLLDTNTGNPLPEHDLYPGCWNMRIIVDYFKDNPSSGTPGKYNLGMGGLDTADELLYRVVSDPVCLTVAEYFPESPYTSPFIDAITPERIPNGGFFEIYGVNFGSIQGTSYVLGGTDSALIEILGNGKGNEDGKCQKAEYLANDCTLDPAKSRIVPIISWSNIEIICDLPTLSAKLPLRAHIQVVVEGTKTSYLKKFEIY